MRGVGINLLSQFPSVGKPIQEGHPTKFNLEKSLLILIHWSSHDLWHPVC